MKKLLIVLLLPVQIVFGQQQVSLDSCYAWARQNYPNLSNSGVWEQIAALKKENVKTIYRPQLTLNGQASYQSDVTSLDISLPSSISSQVSFPTLSKDHYKVYAELKQTLWDGGVSAAQDKLEDAILNSNLSELEVELYKLKEQVAQAFFTVLAIDRQTQVLNAQSSVLQNKLKLVRSGIKNGAMEASSSWEIEAGILTLEQNGVQLEAAQSAAKQILSILTGQTINATDKFGYKPVEISSDDAAKRPEKELFALRRTQLENQSRLLQKNRNPKFFGFGRAGYGRPGLNMLSDDFDTYYLVGVGFSWNAFDWKSTSRKKEILRRQSQIITHQEETFDQNICLLLARQKTQIDKIKKLLETDAQMVALRSNIAKTSASKLENETITSSDYVEDVQSETIAKLNAEIHKIQLDEAKEKYAIIQGKNRK